MLSERFSGLDTLSPKFVEGIHFDCFEGIEQLDYFINLALTDKQRTEKIADNGMKFANENYRAEHLAAKVLLSSGIIL
jgi:hypothetical protein